MKISTKGTMILRYSERLTSNVKVHSLMPYEKSLFRPKLTSEHSLNKGDANMDSKNSTVGRSLLVRVEHDSEIVCFITELAKKNKIMTATFTAIGALKNAKLGFYDQEKHEYSELVLSSPQEIASCTGNVSLKEGEPFVHAHAVLADQNGNTKAGHLLEGTVFAAEVSLTELLGARLVRKKDAVTGLSLWEP
jgi:predicted DNA-binding protein with PD1-like motif